MQGFIKVTYPPPEYTMLCWAAWQKWYQDEVNTYGSERRMISQEPYCPLCGGEALDHNEVNLEPSKCRICKTIGPFYETFFRPTCPVRE